MRKSLFNRRADNWNDQGAASGFCDGRAVLKAWIEPRNVLQMEGQIWWDGFIVCRAPEVA